MDIITLLNDLVEGIFEAEAKFLENPKDFSVFEVNVHKLFDQGALKFVEGVLNNADQMVCNSLYRKGHYDIARHDTRTLITSVGDVQFRNTLFKSKEDGSFQYLLSKMMGLGQRERFSEAAEAQMLIRAIKSSYSEAAKALPSKSEITKTTVMNKVHHIAKTMPEESKNVKKACRILYVEADEDHVAEQHGKGSLENNKSFISRLVYVYEGKNDICKDRKQLVGVHYISGLYEGSEGIQRIWEETWNYIRKHYDTTVLEKIYVSGDGAKWIKASEDYLPLSEFVLDKFHLGKYINSAAKQMQDKRKICRSELYHLIVGNHRKRFISYIGKMLEGAVKSEPVEALGNYVLNNWEAIQRAFHDKEIQSCSAEGHVSYVLSERLSSRPMGWSQRGADRMSMLRCFVRNHGEAEIINLVKYTRKEKLNKKTGTDDIVPVLEKYRHNRNEGYNQAKSYIERIQATIPSLTARKTYAIRNQLGLI